MRVLITLWRFSLGGTESYSATVAEQLERLGHSVSIYAPEATPEGREKAASLGLSLAVGEVVPDGFDAVLAQDAESAQLLAGRTPAPRQMFAVHGLAPFELPPAGLDPAPTVIVFNDRTGRRVEAAAAPTQLVRLCQPIDITRFRPRGAPAPRARRVLALSNNINAARMEMLEGACADAGLTLVRAGGPGAATIDPQEMIAAADIVVGYGRSVLEGMAMGRPAYIWDRGGGDGWVTPESYSAIESDGFSGAATDRVIGREELAADLADYRPELGELGFDLVRTHHSAAKHAEELVDLFGGATAPARQEAAETISLLVRAEKRAARRAEGTEYAHGELLRQLSGLHGENESLRREAKDLRGRAVAAEGERVGRIAAEERLAALTGSRSWRLTAPLRGFGFRLRRSQAGAPGGPGRSRS